MSDEHVISGTIVYGDEPRLIEGYLCVKDGIITEVGTDSAVDATLDGLVTPCFVNAHTHIGDSIIKDPPLSDLDSLVRPPNGLKHRVLDESLAFDLKDAMHRTLNDMIRTGTCAFCDFREGGIEGASMLADTLATNTYASGGLEGMIMGRPQHPGRSGNFELDDLVEVCNGIGMSGVNDVPFEVLQIASRVARRAGKLFAIHGGEKDISDISRSIELKPDFIVHLTHASEAHIKQLVDADIPAVVCSRSNFVTRVGSSARPPVAKMLEMGVTVAAGTDNVMLNSANMFSEMEFLSKVYGLEDRQVFNICTLNGARVLGLAEHFGSIQEGKQAKLMVLDKKSSNLSNSHNMLASFVRRGRPDDIKTIIT
ncbi:MAG: amidohydrolase family protein [Methanosarcinales archaeon]|nr:amidohydrolase family protein [Methanosarcinales archaeon]